MFASKAAKARVTLAILAVSAGAAILAPGAGADHGEPFGAGFGMAEDAGLAPAYPGEMAFWAGTCELSAGDASEGVGSPPAVSAHCIDHGEPSLSSFAGQPTWRPGSEPAWRLSPMAQAGGRADGTVSFWFKRSPHVFPQHGTYITTDGEVRDLEVKLPPGVVGNPGAVPKCSSRDLQSSPPLCPPETQVGLITVSVALFGVVPGSYPVYNAAPREGKAAELMVSPQGEVTRANTPIVARPRTESDHGIDTLVTRIPGGIPLLGQTITIWGVPWAGDHDAYRAERGRQNSIPITGLPDPAGDPLPYDPSWGPIRPFFSNPTECAPDPPVTRWTGNSWQFPDRFAHAEAPADSTVEGCEAVPFDPDIAMSNTSRRADSPTGLDVELEIPQNNDLPFDPPEPGAGQAEVDQYLDDAVTFWKSDEGLATSHLKDTVVTLPAGFSINPSAASGRGVCTSAQIGLTSEIGEKPITFNNDDPSDGKGRDCPPSATVGSAVVETPLLEPQDWPEGEVYLAAQGDNPFGSDYAIYLALRSPDRGLVMKLAGEVSPRESDGRLTATFADNPQLPFERFKLRFAGGPQAPLATPPVCGTRQSRSELSPYSNPDDPVVITQGHGVTSSPAPGCPTSLGDRPLKVGFDAGSASTPAGAHTDFSARFTRRDGNQELDRIVLNTPEGFTANLSGIPYCSEGRIARAEGRTAAGDGAKEKANPSCPAASKIGTTTIGAGAGSSPFYVDGNVYLAGPYKDAPLSMVFVVPAVAGPFDLGVQVVRAQLQVNDRTAQITTVSDRIPKILRGVPLRIRDIRVNIDRDNFALNPTNCNEQAVWGAVHGSHGAETPVGTRFQVGNCEALGFNPRFGMQILNRGRNSTLRSFHPATRFVVAPRQGDANISRAAVTLPRALILDQSNIGTTCTRDQFAARNCPERSVMGYARAFSPLLDQPVEGTVYLGSSTNPLPDLVADLRGQVPIVLRGRIVGTQDGRIRNIFDIVPDVPVSHFVLQMRGGRNNGLLVNSTDLCRANMRGHSAFFAHNGRRQVTRPPMQLGFKGCRQTVRQQARALQVRKRKIVQAFKRGRISRAQAKRLLQGLQQAQTLRAPIRAGQIRRAIRR